MRSLAEEKTLNTYLTENMNSRLRKQLFQHLMDPSQPTSFDKFNPNWDTFCEPCSTKWTNYYRELGWTDKQEEGLAASDIVAGDLTNIVDQHAVHDEQKLEEGELSEGEIEENISEGSSFSNDSSPNLQYLTPELLEIFKQSSTL